MLPDRSRTGEDSFVEAWTQATDLTALPDVITAAVDARRPRLAARLVGLLEPSEDEAPALTRARSAARLLLRSGGDPAPEEVDEFQEIWRRSRKLFMDRVRRRQRARHGVKGRRNRRRR